MDKNKLFGQIAIKLGFVNLDQVAEALKEQAEDISNGINKHLGIYLYNEGLLTKEQIQKIIELQKKYIERSLINENSSVQQSPTNSSVNNFKHITCPNCGYEEDKNCRECSECGTTLFTKTSQNFSDNIETQNTPQYTETTSKSESLSDINNSNSYFKNFIVNKSVFTVIIILFTIAIIIFVYNWVYTEGPQLEAERHKKIYTEDPQLEKESYKKTYTEDPQIGIERCKTADKYITGEGGIKPDFKIAVQLYQKVAVQENLDIYYRSYAQCKLGLLYFIGADGVDQDDEKAIDFFKKSASHGNTIAHYYLGEMYKDGKGVVKDTAIAWAYYRVYSEYGLEEEFKKSSEKNLEEIGKLLTKTQSDKAATWYIKLYENIKSLPASNR